MACLVKTDLLPFRFTSVYRAEAMVASGVLPWQLICCLSKASLHRTTATFSEPARRLLCLACSLTA